MKDIKQELYRAAFEYEKKYGGCAQCTMAAINEHLLSINNDVFASATALAAGIASTGNMCCACVGSIMALGTIKGRTYQNLDTEIGNVNKMATNEVAKKIIQRFEEKYGSCLCKDIQEKLLGRGYDMTLPEEREAFLVAGGHGDYGCPTVTGNAVIWLYEELEKEGLISYCDRIEK